MVEVIPAAADGIFRARKTVALTGAANLGAVGAMPYFTTTGAVAVVSMFQRGSAVVCAGSGGMISVGTAADDAGISPVSMAIPNGYTGVISPRYYDAGGGADLVGPNGDYNLGNGGPDGITQDIKGTVSVEALTGGTLVIDVWYRKITDNGSLVAA